MNTLLVESVAFDVSLLESETVTPPLGAGEPSFTERGTCWPGDTTRLAGRVNDPLTVTAKLMSAMLGAALAWITALPAPTAVTGTETEEAPGGRLAAAGTVATLMSEELRLMVRPVGAGTGSWMVTFWVPVPLMVSAGGLKTAVVET
jgi:hypothetical protein